MKFGGGVVMRGGECRSPQGERGLKCCRSLERVTGRLSLPTGGAWVEIDSSMSVRGWSWSLPTGGAWVEIARISTISVECGVAPHRGSVG